MEKELPEGWEITELGKVCEKVSQVKPEEKPDDTFTYIDIASIDNAQNKITSPKLLLGREAPSRARQLVKTGDTVFSTVRTYLKNIAFVSEDLDKSIASTGFCVVRPKIDKKYVFYYTQLSTGQKFYFQK